MIVDRLLLFAIGAVLFGMLGYVGWQFIAAPASFVLPIALMIGGWLWLREPIHRFWRKQRRVDEMSIPRWQPGRRE